MVAEKRAALDALAYVLRPSSFPWGPLLAIGDDGDEALVAALWKLLEGEGGREGAAMAGGGLLSRRAVPPTER